MKTIDMRHPAVAIMAAVLATAASCSKPSPGPAPAAVPSPISFSTYLSRPVARSTGSLTAASLPSYGFGVFASYTGEDGFSPSSDIPSFMYNVPVRHSASSDTWSYSPLRYWPRSSSEKVTFLAYAPYVAPSGANDQGISDLSPQTAPPSFTFTLSSSADVDLLYASRTDVTPQSSAVQLIFSHMLSKLRFAVSTSANPSTSVTLTGFSITSGLPRSSTFSLNSGVFSSPAGTYDGIRLTGLSTPATPDSGTPASFGGEYMVIPTSGTLSGTVSYTYCTTDTDGYTTPAITVTDAPFSAPISLESGKIHTLTLSIGLTAITFTVTSVTDWAASASSPTFNFEV